MATFRTVNLILLETIQHYFYNFPSLTLTQKHKLHALKGLFTCNLYSPYHMSCLISV